MTERCDCLGIAHDATFVPPPLAHDLIAGFVDLHVHTAPDVFGRALDDDEAALSAQRARMGGFVFKNHVSETASRAELAHRRHGIDAYGGVVLNRSVGGVNADAVDAVARIEGGRGRIVWLPTVDARNHRRMLDGNDDGLDVVIDGKPTPELEAVLRICAANDLALQTGHTGAADALVVAELAASVGVRCCITHALFPIIGFTREHVAQAIALGASIELCAIGALMGPHAAVPWMRTWGLVDAVECADYVARFGPEHFIISSDLGQSGNPIPSDGLRRFVDALQLAGLGARDVRRMGRENARTFIGLPAS